MRAARSRHQPARRLAAEQLIANHQEEFNLLLAVEQEHKRRAAQRTKRPVGVDEANTPAGQGQADDHAD